MKDLKEKLKRKISEMLDREDLTAEQLGHLTSAVCMLHHEESMKAMNTMSALSLGAAIKGMRRNGDNDDTETT